VQIPCAAEALWRGTANRVSLQYDSSWTRTPLLLLDLRQKYLHTPCIASAMLCDSLRDYVQAAWNISMLRTRWTATTAHQRATAEAFAQRCESSYLMRTARRGVKLASESRWKMCSIREIPRCSGHIQLRRSSICHDRGSGTSFLREENIHAGKTTHGSRAPTP
jgi:hypothetical protein